MGFLSHKVKSSEIEAGDHIYSWRTSFTYSHHGIYVGGNKVVHFTHKQNSGLTNGLFVSCSSKSVMSSLNFSACPNKLPACSPDCGFHQPESGVVLSCLDCFLAGGSLYRFEYGMSPAVFLVKIRAGTCTTANSDAPDVVIRRTMYLLHNGFGNYNVFENNCEDFALYCKTGLRILDQRAPGGSGQVSGVIGAPLAAILSSPLRLFMSNPIGIATGVGLYCWNRYATDIGVRNDVIKVEVEDMVSFRCSESPTKPAQDVRCHKRLLNVDEMDINDVIKVEVEDMVSFRCSESPTKPAQDVRCHKRLLNVDERDINDVIKVEVEDMVSFRCSESPTKPAQDVRCHKRLLNVDERDIPASKRQMC